MASFLDVVVVVVVVMSGAVVVTGAQQSAQPQVTGAPPLIIRIPVLVDR